MQKTLTILAILALTGFSVKHTSNNKAAAEADQVQGIFVFTDSKPVASYKVLGTVDISRKESRKSNLPTNPQYHNVRNLLLANIKEEYPAADGAILHLNPGGKDYATAIKFE